MSEWAAWTQDDIAAQGGDAAGPMLTDDVVDACTDPSDARHVLRAWNMVVRRRFAERLNAPEGCQDAIAVCTLHLRRLALQAVRDGIEPPTAALHSFTCPAWFDWWPVWLDAIQETLDHDADMRRERRPDLSWLDGAARPVAAPKPPKRTGRPTRPPAPSTPARRAVEAAAAAWRAFPEVGGDWRHELDETIRAAARLHDIPSTRGFAAAVYEAVGVDQ